MEKTQVVLVGLYTYFNVPVRILHPLVDRLEGVKAHTIFYKNYDTNVFSLPTAREEEIFIETINQLKPTIVGISLLSPYVLIAKRLTELIKQHTSAMVVWGGVGPTLSPEDHIKLADVITVGEGERAFEELVESVRDKKEYRNIKNLWVKDGTKVIKNPQGPLVQDLDNLPFAEYGNENMYFIENNKLSREDPELDHSILYIQSSRGCPYSCSFCIETMYHEKFKDLGKFVRRRTVGNIIKEVHMHLNKPNNRKKRVYFIDEVFGSAPNFIDEFAPRWKKEVGLPFEVLYHPKSLKLRVIDRLVEAGVTEVNFGIQTGSEKIRNEVFTRPGSNAEIIELTGALSKNNIRIKYDLILDNDFETKETLKECINLILQLPKPLSFNIYSLQHFPDYPMTKMAIKAGHITEKELGDWPEMMKRTTTNMKFIPRLIKRKNTKTKQLQRLNNIIWMQCHDYATNSLIKKAVFGRSIISKILFHYINFKSVLMWRIYGEGGWLHSASFKLKFVSYPLAAIKMFLKGDWKELSYKLNKRTLSPIRKYINTGDFLK